MIRHTMTTQPDLSLPTLPTITLLTTTLVASPTGLAPSNPVHPLLSLLDMSPLTLIQEPPKTGHVL